MTNPVPKLLCVSLNPAIDRRIVVPHLRLGEVNRARSADPVAGGKAAHVAYAAKQLGASVRWLAFIGGPEGDACRTGIQSRGITAVAVPVAGSTRMTLELIDESARQITEVLEPGPTISAAEQENFLALFDREIAEAECVVLSGSLPSGLPANFYADLVHRAKRADCRVFLDTSGPALRAALAARPDLIKPNQDEAEALLSRAIHSDHDAATAAVQLQNLGPSTAVLSRGANGAIVASPQGLFSARPPCVEAVSTVGSGDSFLAGWAFAATQGLPAEDCLRLAVACGTANCFATSPGMVSRARVEELLPRIKIDKLPPPA